MPDPIDSVVWRPAKDLHGNDYNPNAVLMPELKLLERSLRKNGWVAPITILPDLTIVDGFHRWRLALDCKWARERWGGKVPTVTVDCPPDGAKAMTIRLNRARGTHVAVRMSEMVRGLISDGVPKEAIAADFGMTPEEVEVLSQDSIFTARNLDQYRYSRAWIPAVK